MNWTLVQARQKVKNGWGGSSNVVGIICLPGWNTVNWSAKSLSEIKMRKEKTRLDRIDIEKSQALTRVCLMFNIQTWLLTTTYQDEYRTCPIISRGLYIFYFIVEDHFFLFPRRFQKIVSLCMIVLSSQERLWVMSSGRMGGLLCWLCPLDGLDQHFQ